ncbi:MAG: Uma2 family endonuclease [Chloroflexi bacterium]|nr:Uma2 family endonuclease [Chloroflexota bacterium]
MSLMDCQTMDVPQIGLLTEHELMALGSDARIEVHNGEVVEMNPVGILHHLVAGNFYDALKPFVVQNRLGYVFMDGLLCLLDISEGGGIKGAQVPDVCFIRRGRIPKDWNLERPFPGAPDLAIEVVSPDDDPDELLGRVRKYLAKGSEQVWVAYPRQQEVHQYRGDSPDSLRVYRGQQVIEAESLFPGLKLVAHNFFVLPDLGEG